jgi:hypothetical protein
MSDPAAAWPILTPLERRILGVLVEKAKTTPDVYPMSINSLVNGCNQKSNRDPLMNVDETQVEETLEGLQPKGLVIKVTGTRVDRWRQLLYEVWTSNKIEMAVLAELLLRSPQTEGELRGRAARMEPIDDVEQLRAILKPLAERNLVVYLTPERSRGTTLTHGFHSPEELAWLRKTVGRGDPQPDPSPALNPSPKRGGEESLLPSAPPRGGAGGGVAAEIERLSSEVEKLRADLNRVMASVVSLQQALGISPNPG